ncbi:MAG: NAD(P)H-hydrate dehydratase [Christensenellaceae bacterium]
MRMALTPEKMRAVDQYMIQTLGISGIVLMENAARGVCDVIMDEYEPCTVRVFCGAGNNGGDGFAVARILIAHGYDVQVAVAAKQEEIKGDAAVNFEFFRRTGEYHIFVQDEKDLEELYEVDLIVDALFGTGLCRNVQGFYQKVIQHINDSDADVISVDIPSGIDAQNGQVMGEAVAADFTVTFQYAKTGHFLFPGRANTGILEVVKIGVDEGCEVLTQENVCVYESDDEDICMGRRELNTNKGDYGRLLLVAGSFGMAGAAILAARAASKAGAGLVTVASTDEVVGAVQSSVPYVTCKVIANEEGTITRKAGYDIERLLKGKTALAVGPGLGINSDIVEVVRRLIGVGNLVKIIDADALNAVAQDLNMLKDKQGELILTPHPKEFSRLIDVSVKDILSNPIRYAVEFAVEYEVTLVLKGATTVIADKFGNATLVCAGCAGMAKGGSGDVLTGIISGLAAQGKDAYESALCGVYLAAMAGEAAEREKGEYAMTPMDTVDAIGREIERIIVDTICADTVKKEEKEIPPSLKTAGVSEYKDYQTQVYDEQFVQPQESENSLEEDSMLHELSEKSPEEILKEIEEKEETQEINRDILSELIENESKTSKDPTRRRIG